MQDASKQFFISYTKADLRWAEWTAWQLEGTGYTTVLQAWDFRPGANFVEEMVRSVQEAERTIAILSPNYLTSLYTKSEWQAAFHRDPTGEKGLLVPVRVEECEPPGILGERVYIDLVAIDESIARERLLAGVQRGRARPTSPPAFPAATRHTSVTQQPKNFPGAQPGIWNVPYQRNPFSLGQEKVLENLETSLMESKTAAGSPSSSVIRAISGSSGIGKTQAAVEYAYRYRSDYKAVLWANAETRETLTLDFMHIAQLLKLPEKSAPDQSRMIEAVKFWLQTHDQWLLILDNVKNQELLKAFIPSIHKGHVLLTTQASQSDIKEVEQWIEAQALKPEEEEELRLQRTKVVRAALKGPRGRIMLGIETLRIGRASDNQLVLNDLKTSMYHAEVRLGVEGHRVIDLQSTNGTFVNGRRLENNVPYLLQPNDALYIGETTFIYETSSIGSMDQSWSSPPQTPASNVAYPASPQPSPVVPSYPSSAPMPSPQPMYAPQPAMGATPPSNPSRTRYYQAQGLDIQQLTNELERMFFMQGYQVQHFGNQDQMTIQFKKGSSFEAILGMQAALTFTMQRSAGGILAVVGQQKWADKVAAGAVGALVLWPLAFTAGAGAIRQANLSSQLLNTLDGLVRQQQPNVQVGPIPPNMMPQIQPGGVPSPQSQPQPLQSQPQPVPQSWPQQLPPSAVSLPARTKWGYLLFVDGRKIELAGERVTLGRYQIDTGTQSLRPDINLNGLPEADTVSYMHAALSSSGGSCILSDLNSTNGTFINGQRLEPHKVVLINDGDMIHFGRVACTFRKT